MTHRLNINLNFKIIYWDNWTNDCNIFLNFDQVLRIFNKTSRIQD